MSCKGSFLESCKLFEASPADVPAAFLDLSRDMNPEFVHVFQDKLERYAQKPDRALFLLRNQDLVIGFATIIEKAPVPNVLEGELVAELNTYSCGTGLMVMPEWRKKGVATLLVEAWELWSREHELPGIWVVSRKMAPWYRRHFQYLQVASIHRHGVLKTVLAKRFL